jgi:hypothetical protein
LYSFFLIADRCERVAIVEYLIVFQGFFYGYAIIRRRTSRKKLRASIAAFTEWIKSNRNQKISKLMTTLRAKFRGYWNYYGVIGNYDSSQTFYYRSTRILLKWFNRRSQRLSYNWAGFQDLMRQFMIPAPKITEKYPSKQLKLFV